MIDNLIRIVALSCLMLLPLANSASAVQICWIDHVVKQGAGILVYFQEGRPVSVNHGGEPARYVIGAGSQLGIQPGLNAVEAVPAVLGDKLFVRNSPEDGCNMEVVARDGKIGLFAAAFLLPPGFSRIRDEKFFPAD